VCVQVPGRGMRRLEGVGGLVEERSGGGRGEGCERVETIVVVWGMGGNGAIEEGFFGG